MPPSSLPIEIWRVVLRLAVHVEGSLVSSLSTNCGQIQWLRWQYDDSVNHAQSMVTKRALLLVCKSWSIIAIELLYEDVRIKTTTGMESLHAALTAPRGGEGAWLGF